MKTYLEYTDEKSNKFWEIELNSAELTLTVRFGKIGSAGTTQSKKYPDKPELFSDYRKQINEKMNNGYVFGATGIPGSAGKIMAAFRDLSKLNGFTVGNHCSKILVPDEQLIADDFKTITKEIGFSLPNEFREQYFCAEYLSYTWEFSDDEEYEPLCSGEVSLSGPEQAVDFNYVEPEELYGSKKIDREFVKSLRYFDAHPRTGDGFMVFFRLEKDKEHLELYIDRNCYGEFEKLNLTWSEYLHHTEKLLGLYGWQYLYTESGFYNKSDSWFDNSTKDIFIAGLEQLEKAFPQNDYSEYRKLAGI